MKNNFDESLAYDKNAKNWQQSAEEIAKFILDHLDRGADFLNFIRGEELEFPERAERWQIRLLELMDKATKRLGHDIGNRRDLLLAARQIIVYRQIAGELPSAKFFY